LDNIKKSTSTNEDELNYLHYLKLSRLIKIIVFNFNVNYEVIKFILEIINDNQNKSIWKLNLSMEFIFNIMANYDLLQKIYKSEENLLTSIFNVIKDFINHIETLKDERENKKVDSIISSFMKKKDLDNNKIYIEGDEIVIFKEHSKKFYKHLINDCLQNIIDSLIKINKGEKIENEELKIFDAICDNLKDIILKLISNEMNKKSSINISTQNDIDCDLKIYLNYIQNMMELYKNFNMLDKRDEYLKYLCEIAQSFPEDKNNDEKNIFIALTLINLSKTNSLLNKNSLVIILQTIEIFNHTYNYIKLNEYIKSDLDKILKDINKCFFEYIKSSKDKNLKKKGEKVSEEGEENMDEDNEKKVDTKKNVEEKKELDKKDSDKKEDKKEDAKKKN
jgi:hypothetical protein